MSISPSLQRRARAVPSQWTLTLFVMSAFFMYAVGCVAATALAALGT